MIDVIVIAGFIVAIVALWTKKAEYKKSWQEAQEVIGQMVKGAEIQAKREVVLKSNAKMLANALQGYLDEEAMAVSEPKHLCAVLEKKARQLEQALKMEQQERAKLEESLKYYMELLGEQMNTGAPKPMNDDMSRYALRACLADALDRNAKLQRLIRRMRDRGRFPQIAQIDPQITLIENGEIVQIAKGLDAEFDSLRAGGPTTAIIQGDDAYELKHEAEIPAGEVAVECEGYEIGEVRDAQGV